MNPNDILDMLNGMDKKNEIINLWYEINFVRHCLNKIINLNPELLKDFNQETLNQCREFAQEEVKLRFPDIKIEFKPNKSINSDNLN